MHPRPHNASTSPTPAQPVAGRLARCHLAAALIVLVSASAPAQTVVYWDTNGATSGSSGGTTAGGTWNQNSTANWTINSGGTAATATWQTRSGGSGIATFSAGSNATGTYTVTVSGTITGVRGLEFEEGTVTLSGGTITLGATSTVDTNANSATIGSVIAGNNFGLTKSGVGTLTLSGANTYSGATTINGGILAVSTLANGGANSGIGRSSSGAANLVLNGGTLRYTGATTSTNRQFTLGVGGGSLDASGSGTVTFSSTGGVTNTGAGNRTLTLTGTNTGNNTLAATIGNPSSGTTSIAKTGAGTWVLSGNNSYSGATTINDGVLAIANFGALGNSGNALVLDGGTLRWTGASATTSRVPTLGASGGAIDASGTGTLGFTSGSNLLFSGTGARTLTLTGSNTGNNVFNVVIRDAAAGAPTTVVKSGSGTWMFDGNNANTYSGDTIIESGTLILDKKSGRDATGAGNIIVGDGVSSATLKYHNTSNQLDNTANIYLNHNGTLDLNSRTDGMGVIADGSLVSNGFGRVLLGSGALTTGASNASGTFSGVISGTGTVTKTGTGTWTLAGNNTFSGGLTLNSGGLSLGHSGALGTGELTIGSGTTLDNGTGGALTLTNNNALRLNGAFTFIGSNSLNLGAGTATLAANTTVNAQAATLTFDGILTDANSTYSLTKDGAGTLILSGANTYTGATRVNGGVLAVNTLANGGSASAIGNSSNAATNLILDGGTLRYTGAASVSNRLFSLGTSGGTIENNGTGTLTLSNPGAMGFNGESGARTLQVVGSADIALASAIGDSGGATSLVKSGASSLTVSGNSSYSGTTTVATGSTLIVAGNNALGSAAGGTTVASGATLGFQGGVSYAAAEALSVSGSGAMGRSGAVDNISGTNSFAGAITLNGSTTFGITSGALTLGGSINLASNASSDATLTFATNTGTAVSANGLISDLQNVNFQLLSVQLLGNGTLTLANSNNSYGGNTIVGTSGGNSTGTLRLGANSALPAGANGFAGSYITVYSGTLDLNGYNAEAFGDATVAGLGQNNVGLVLGGGAAGSTAAVTTGTGTLTLTKNLVYDATNNPNGATIAGKLKLGGTSASNTHNIAVGNSTAANYDLTISAAISDGGTGNISALQKYGTGTLLLSGNNTYLGVTAIQQGILSVQHSNALGGAANAGASVSSGAALQLSNAANGNLNVATKLTLSGNGIGGNGALQNVAGTNTWSGGITVTTANTRIQAESGTQLTLSGNINSSTSGSLEFGGAGSIHVSGAIGTGVTGVTKKDGGTTTLAGLNAFSGPVAVQAGTLSVQSNSALGMNNTATVSNGATLAFDSTANGPLTITTGTINVNGTGAGGAGALRNTAGNNVFSGTVNLQSSSTLASNAGTVLSVATVRGVAGSTVTFGTAAQNGNINVGTLSNAAGLINLVKVGAATGSDGRLTINHGTVDTVNLAGGAMTVTSGTLNTGDFTAAAGTSLLVASGGTVNVTGDALFNNGTLDALSSGTLQIIGNNTATFVGTNTATSLNLVLGGSSVGTNAAPLTVILGNTLSVGVIEIVGDTILDFGNSGSTILTSGALRLTNPNAKVQVVNWISTANQATSDLWFATSTVNNTTLGSQNQTPTNNSGLGQISFVDPQGSYGNTTTWVADTSSGWYDHEIRPTPEPGTYGLIFMSGMMGVFGWRRYRQRQPAKNS